MGIAAATLSRRAVAERESGIVNAALHRLVDLVYETVDGVPCNIDAQTGRVLVGMPTSRLHYQTYGLTSTHQRALRVAMLLWAREEEPPPLFVFEPLDRRWYCCMWHYPSLAIALRWLDVRKMTAGMWLGLRA